MNKFKDGDNVEITSLPKYTKSDKHIFVGQKAKVIDSLLENDGTILIRIPVVGVRHWNHNNLKLSENLVVGNSKPSITKNVISFFTLNLI